MKSFIAVLAVVAVAVADVSHLRPSTDDKNAEILRYNSDVRPDGYDSAYETSNGIQAQESGQLKQINKDESAVVAQGSYQYTAPDGQTFQITYVADENGYQPQGAHLPTPPPTQAIPEAIARSIIYNQQHAGRDAPPQAQFQRF